MREALSRWESSGLTQREFAAREQIPYSTLQYWRRRLRKAAPAKQSSRSEPLLAAVHVVPDPQPVPNTSAFEVRTADGLALSIPQDFDANELQRLLTVLRAC
jgi:hypothetical protein